MAENVLVAGHETTSNSIAAGLHRLASEPDLQRRLRQAPTAIAKFVEELLRTEAPVQMMPRYATQDTVLGELPSPRARWSWSHSHRRIGMRRSLPTANPSTSIVRTRRGT